jgi:hypothetical protein
VLTAAVVKLGWLVWWFWWQLTHPYKLRPAAGVPGPGPAFGDRAAGGCRGGGNSRARGMVVANVAIPGPGLMGRAQWRPSSRTARVHRLSGTLSDLPKRTSAEGERIPETNHAAPC